MSGQKRVTVLQGGWSAEREVSLASGAAVAKACRELGYEVTEIDVQPDIAAALTAQRPERVFNALHGKWGEDGCIQGVLDILNVPYTHSGVLASALAMYKPLAKEVFRGAGIPCPGGMVVSRREVLKREPLPRPYVIKPLDEGSSVGVSIIMPEDNYMMDNDNWPFGAQVLVEPYIAGREIQVAVLDGKAIGAIEIRPKGRFYDYEAKYTGGKAEHLMPAPIPEADYVRILGYAERAHAALGCRGLTRADFRYDDTHPGEAGIYLLEVNTQPGMTPLSLAPEIAAHAGIGFAELVDRLLHSARCGN